MCQSHLQIRYRRRARTTISVTVNAMPNPFLARALGLVCTKETLPEEMKAGATLFRRDACLALHKLSRERGPHVGQVDAQPAVPGEAGSKSHRKKCADRRSG
jgi:hypothetical protein